MTEKTIQTPAAARPRRRHLFLRLAAFAGIAMVLAIGTGASSGAQDAQDATTPRISLDSAFTPAEDVFDLFDAADDGGPPELLFYTEQAPNQFGWYNTSVLIHVVCVDDDPPVSCPGSFWISEGQTVYISSTDGLGDTVSGLFGPLPIDQTPPTISITNGGREWAQGSAVALGCDISDNRSGLVWLSNPCPFWGQPASDFEPGTYTVNVQATDAALNYTSVTTTFTIVK